MVWRKRVRLVGIVLGAFQQGFDEAFDERERRAQFVADVGDEFLARAFQLLDAGEIVEDEDGAAAACRRGRARRRR